MSSLWEFMYIDATKVYTTADYKFCNPLEFARVFDLKRKGLPFTWTDWCKKNCKSPWAWWFAKDGNCYMGFFDKEEAFLFSLIYLEDCD